MIPIPRFVRGAIDDSVWHLTQDDNVTLCGNPLRVTRKGTKKAEPEPNCRACRLVFENHWESVARVVGL